MVRTLPLNSETRPELPRILAMAAVIALHALAFLLLLVPLANGPLDLEMPKEPRWTVPKEIPKPPIPPVVVPVVPQQPATRPANSRPTVRHQVVDKPSIVNEGTLPATPDYPLTDTIPDNTGPVDTTPMQMGTQLESISASPPRYPRDAARAGVEGRVLLRILVGTDGKPLEVTIDRSSGNRSLDREARDHVLKSWRFKPAMRDGYPVQAYGLVPIDFTMQ
jgi:protein TonB